MLVRCRQRDYIYYYWSYLQSMQLLSDGSILADSALVLNVCYQSPAVTVPQMLLASGKGTFSHFHLKYGRAGQELTSKADHPQPLCLRWCSLVCSYCNVSTAAANNNNCCRCYSQVAIWIWQQPRSQDFTWEETTFRQIISCGNNQRIWTL